LIEHDEREKLLVPAWDLKRLLCRLALQAHISNVTLRELIPKDIICQIDIDSMSGDVWWVPEINMYEVLRNVTKKIEAVVDRQRRALMIPCSNPASCGAGPCQAPCLDRRTADNQVLTYRNLTSLAWRALTDHINEVWNTEEPNIDSPESEDDYEYLNQRSNYDGLLNRPLIFSPTAQFDLELIRRYGPIHPITTMMPLPYNPLPEDRPKPQMMVEVEEHACKYVIEISALNMVMRDYVNYLLHSNIFWNHPSWLCLNSR